MLHAGVCVPRHDCRHNRAMVYHLRRKALYGAVGGPESRFLRPLTLGHAIHRLMILDAIVESPDHRREGGLT
jgi:hypothetical protein